MITVCLFMFLLIICLILKTFGLVEDVISILFVFGSTIILFYYIIKNKNIEKNIKMYILLALIIRIIFMTIDLYWFRLPNAGSDDEGFYFYSVELYKKNISFSNTTYGGYFTLLLSFLYNFIGINRLGVQYTTIITSIISIIYFEKTMNLLNTNIKTKKIATFLLCFMPNLIILNSILRRDTIITLFVILAIYHIINWHHNNKKSSAMFSLLSIIVASLFHSAIIILFPIFVIYILLYNRKTEKLHFTGSNLIKSFFLILGLIILGVIYLKTFNTKLSFSSINSLLNAVTNTWGNSVYLANIKITNIYQLILFTPVKFIYFLFSPMPWDCRGIVDIITFTLDSLIYLYLFIKILKSKKENISRLFFYSFLILTSVFGLGTFTAGTATRHRYNIFPLMLIVYCISYKKNNNRGNDIL